ncbi:substrate-binding domain-containing protein [Flaviflexus huanghaiensis]|uniref:substrate-binding domain-containing protein n=1 Tax=Flaviflexus huanghaiensis TaxID=1111473 RepID=UPI0015F86422
MNTTRFRKAPPLALAVALGVALAACSDDSEIEETGTSRTTGAAEETTGSDTDNGFADSDVPSDMPTPIGELGVSGSLNGSGASSMANAQQAWRDRFSADYGVTVNYNPTGSGTGRQQFIAGAVSFAGTDSALDEDELEAAANRCGSDVLELPLYISPIAIAYNLPGIDDLNLSAQNVAALFSGEITNWNDEAIAADNEGVEFPDLDVVPFNRADDSGTTENFTQYLVEAAGEDAWPYEPADAWPMSGTQSAQKTSGVVDLTAQTEGAITYADASQIGDLPAANVEVNGEFIAYSPEAAAAIVDGSEPSENATDKILTVDLKRDGSVEGAYPVVMISYLVACTAYESAQEAANVKGYVSFIASSEGQQAAAMAGGGNAPISKDLKSKVMPAIDAIVID